MKRTVVLALLFSLINMSTFLNSFSQGTMDYQTVLPDVIPFFHAPSGPLESSNIRAIRIDSVSQVGTDLELFPYHEPYHSAIPYYECNTPFGPSWIGWKIIIKTNGDNLFLIIRGNYSQIIQDTVLIKTLALPGDSWIFFADEYFDDTVTATVTAVDTMSFLGVTDSVKYISLSSGAELILSKNHGFIRTLKFQDHYLHSSTSLFYLVGSAELGGVDFLTIGEVYDYDIGDIFHIHKWYDNSYAPEYFYVQEVIDKDYSADLDTVFYLMKQFYWCSGGYPPPCNFFSIDTILKTYYNLDQQLESGYLPFESKILPEAMEIHSMKSNASAYHGREYLFKPETLYNMMQSDTCYYSFESLYNDKKYIKGAGSYTNTYGGWVGGECDPCNRLVYYLKGEEEWGTPLIIPLGIKESEEELSKINIYPNPANHSITVVSDAKKTQNFVSELKIYDSKGCEVYKNKQILGREYEINTSFYSPGIYIMLLVSGPNLSSQKFIVQH